MVDEGKNWLIVKWCNALRLLHPTNSICQLAEAPRPASLSRNTRRCTLPVVVIGNASRNSISFGYS
jgi:hypothetical protein